MSQFTDYLSDTLSADLDEELAQRIAECVNTVRNRGGKATLSIKITVSNAGTVGSNRIRHVVSHTVSLPKQPPEEVIAFADDLGFLHSDDPLQGRLFDLKPVRKQAAAVESIRKETVDPTTGEIIPAEVRN